MCMFWLAKAIVIKFICQFNYYYFTRITRWNITMLLSNNNIVSKNNYLRILVSIVVAVLTYRHIFVQLLSKIFSVIKYDINKRK